MFRSSEKKGCDVILWEVVWSECLLSLNVPTTCNSFSMHCIAFTINQTYCGKCMKKKTITAQVVEGVEYGGGRAALQEQPAAHRHEISTWSIEDG